MAANSPKLAHQLLLAAEQKLNTPERRAGKSVLHFINRFLLSINLIEQFCNVMHLECAKCFLCMFQLSQRSNKTPSQNGGECVSACVHVCVCVLMHLLWGLRRCGASLLILWITCRYGFKKLIIPLRDTFWINFVLTKTSSVSVGQVRAPNAKHQILQRKVPQRGWVPPRKAKA